MPHPSDVALSRLKKVLSREPMLRDILADTLPSLGPVGSFQPDVDVFDAAGTHVLLVDLPGVPKDRVRVRLEGARLVVEGERPGPDVKGATRSQERAYGRFRREFLLPTDVQADGVKAHLEEGVLRVEVPRSAAADGRDVPIEG